ncbi:hypothetical protein LCGC14_2292210, partial [marine sediment metagenome]
SVCLQRHYYFYRVGGFSYLSCSQFNISYVYVSRDVTGKEAISEPVESRAIEPAKVEQLTEPVVPEIDPEKEMWDRDLEDLQTMLRPLLFQDVLQTVGIMPPTQPGLVGPDGKTPLVQTRGNGKAGQIAGGYSRQGQERVPPEIPGTTEQEVS